MSFDRHVFIEKNRKKVAEEFRKLANEVLRIGPEALVTGTKKGTIIQRL